MDELTDRQRKVLQLIVDRMRRFGIPPTIDELKDELHISSKFGVVRHLEALAKKGYISRSHKARDIQVLRMPDEEAEFQASTVPSVDGVELPLIGTVTAGMPILAEENIEQHLTVPRHLVRIPQRSFMLRVQGYSMIQAGILDGDLVIVQATGDVKNGDIVVALVGNEVTVKRLVRTGMQSYLKAENPQYPDIYPQEDWSIQGKVIALIREVVQ